MTRHIPPRMPDDPDLPPPMWQVWGGAFVFSLFLWAGIILFLCGGFIGR